MSIARFERVSAEQLRKDAAPFSPVPVPETIPLPKRATPGSAGYDFVSPVSVTLQPGASAVIPTGIRVWMEPGWVLLMFPRSSFGFRYGMRLANTVGVIDGDYYGAANEGHIMAKIVNGGEKPMEIHAGDRFCQGVFVPCGLAEEEAVTGERSGGFGSTGR